MPKKNKAVSPQLPPKVSTNFKSAQGNKKKRNCFVHAHLRFRVLNTKKLQRQSNQFFAVLKRSLLYGKKIRILYTGIT